MVEKRKQIYARFGVQLVNNRRCFKAERAAPGCMGLYAFCVMYARLELPDVDGFIPEEVLLVAWGRPPEERNAQAEALCSVDLLERVDGGYVVVKHAEHNDTKADVAAARFAAKERMKSVRRTSREQTPHVQRTSTEQTRDVQRTEPVCSPDVLNSISISISKTEEGEGVGEGDPNEPPSQVRYREAYCAGIREGKGGGFIWPDGPYSQAELNRIVQEFAGGRRGNELLTHIRKLARDFASEVSRRPNDVKFYSAYAPKGCARWLSERSEANHGRRESPEQAKAFARELAARVTGKVGT